MLVVENIMEDFRSGEIVALRHDVPSLNMRAGDQGVVVFDYGGGIYEVDFLDENEFWGNHWDASELMKLTDEPSPIVAEHAAEITGCLTKQEC
jgi:hypothetical protein